MATQVFQMFFVLTSTEGVAANAGRMVSLYLANSTGVVKTVLSSILHSNNKIDPAGFQGMPENSSRKVSMYNQSANEKIL